jgi:hypothetical protein
MHEIPEAAAFWDGVTALVTTKVEPVIGTSPRTRDPIIAYLRDLEVVARQKCSSRETVQVIASGRRLLGDRSAVALDEGPFAQIRVGPKLKIATRIPPSIPLR